MSSQIVNVNSVLNALASVIGLPIDIVREWFPNESTQRGKALNVRSVANIFKQALLIGFGASVPNPIDTLVANGNITQDEGNKRNSSACSVNTCINLFNAMFANKTWNIVTTYSNTVKYGQNVMVLNTHNINCTAIGGGGGASGALRNNMDGSGTNYTANGADGGPSLVYANDVVILRAEGGAGAPGQQSSTGVVLAGIGGSNAQSATYNDVVTPGTKLRFEHGYGGGGSGGSAMRAGKNSNAGDAAEEVAANAPSITRGGNGRVFGNTNPRNARGGGGGGAGFNNGQYTSSYGGESQNGNSAGTSENGSPGEGVGSSNTLYLGQFNKGGAGGFGHGEGATGEGGAVTSAAGEGGNPGTAGGNGSAGGSSGGSSGSITVSTTDVVYLNLL